MNIDPTVVDFDIKSYEFSESGLDQIQKVPFVKNTYPLVYFINDKEKSIAYVGESTNAINRMRNHLSNPDRAKLDNILLITSEKFNKSATLDIEAKLIKYISADGLYILQNGNAGLSGHNYFQMDMYDQIFREIWDSFRKKKLAKKSIPQIENTNLFKYSPYKTLSSDQHDSVLEILSEINRHNDNTIFVSGAAGTGKSVLATYLMKLMQSSEDSLEAKTDEPSHIRELELIRLFRKKFKKPKIGLVVPMTSLRTTLQNVFKSIDGLKTNMILSPVDVSKEKYDIILVDEAHRLTQRTGIVNYKSFDDANRRLGFPKGTTQLEWILSQSSHQILFYDPEQSIKPADVDSNDFEKVLRKPRSKLISLKSQMRVKGGTDYISFVDRLLNNRLESTVKFESEQYELKLFESFSDLVQVIEEKEKEHGLCRIVAGYAWEWITKKEPLESDLYDIEIEGIKYRWNSNTKEDWVTSENAINEIGCIHTTQGYDLNYTGVIFGDEIKYDPESDKIIVIKENYHDRNGKVKINDPDVLKNYIINIYKTLMFRGIKGTFVYVCDENLRDYLSKYIPKYELDEQVETEILSHQEIVPFENAVPLYSLKVAAGEFGDFQRVEDHDWVKVPDRYRNLKDLFACEVIGESMNKVIPNGSLCLFRKYTGGSRNGKIVLVEHSEFIDTDYGSCYTVKEYHSKKELEGDEWEHESILLKPLSYSEDYNTIELSSDGERSFRVIGIFECVL